MAWSEICVYYHRDDVNGIIHGHVNDCVFETTAEIGMVGLGIRFLILDVE
jgi:hypothetical protein